MASVEYLRKQLVSKYYELRHLLDIRYQKRIDFLLEQKSRIEGEMQRQFASILSQVDAASMFDGNRMPIPLPLPAIKTELRSTAPAAFGSSMDPNNPAVLPLLDRPHRFRIDRNESRQGALTMDATPRNQRNGNDPNALDAIRPNTATPPGPTAKCQSIKGLFLQRRPKLFISRIRTRITSDIAAVTEGREGLRRPDASWAQQRKDLFKRMKMILNADPADLRHPRKHRAIRKRRHRGSPRNKTQAQLRR